MLVSDQTPTSKPPSSPKFRGVSPPGTTMSSSSHSSSGSISRRSPLSQHIFGDDTDPPNTSKRIGVESSSFISREENRPMDDHSSHSSEIDCNSGHGSTLPSRASFESHQSASSGPGSGRRHSSVGESKNEHMKVKRKNRKVDIPPAFQDILKNPTDSDDNDGSSTGTPRSRGKEQARLDIDDGDGDGGTPITRNTSNLMTYLVRGNVALSITLTAISSLVTVFTIPFVVNLAMQQFMGEATALKLPFLTTIVQIAVITLIPVSLGMVLHHYAPKFVAQVEKGVKWLSIAFLTLIIIGLLAKERANVASFFLQVGGD
mmetsp:Transcript_15170/g.24548  ORF Transcript_15170/g.24548 Transcript_15170/m.24548 type:complete len:317 (-) Transcript_15170:906-1856(-)